MTEEMNDPTVDDQRFLDRLVDGELPDHEVRSLLLAFDEQPSNWRRLAMAFLEAQAWGRECGSLREPCTPSHLITAESKPSVRQHLRHSQVTYVAACALIMAFSVGAFGAGDYLHRWMRPPALAPQFAAPSHSTPAVSTPLRPNAADRPSVLAESESANEPTSVTFYVGDQPDGPHQVQLPLVELDEDGERWLRREEMAPRGMREVLRRLGHEVGAAERFVEPIRLNDGRRVLVPMEQWEIVPISQRSYQ